MDPITAIATSVDSPVVTALGTLINNPIIYTAIILTLLFTGEERTEKRKKILLCLAIVIFLNMTIKYALAHERPCAGEEWCPKSYSFPSTHAAIAFALMTPFLNKRSYPFYLLFALFVSFSRLNLGVHVFQDVVAALPIAMISYYITYLIWEKVRR